MTISTAHHEPTDSTKPDRGLQVAMLAARTALENRGYDVQILDTRKDTPLFDYFVIATGTSRRQLHAMSDEIELKLKTELNDQRLGLEGYRESEWIVLDYGDVVIHLFDSESRDYYRLEDLWGDAPRVAVPAMPA